jgi:hypothetical protein
MCDDGDQLTYCHHHVLPIWERWTDANPAMRRLIECNGADPRSCDELFRKLLAASRELRLRGESASVQTALAAATACYLAYLGVSHGRFIAACIRAEERDRAAREELPG